MPEKQVIELPAGPIEGGGVYPPWPHRPGIEELPAGPIYDFSREAITELFRLRDRVHALESQVLATRINLPFKPPWWRSEIPPFLEARFPNPVKGSPGEIPPPEDFATLSQAVSSILQRLNAIEASLATLTASTNAPS
jgi:hypothetical protein